MIRDLRGNYSLGVLGAYAKGIDGFIAGGCFRSIFERVFPAVMAGNDIKRITMYIF
jgi:hypothetical protein